MSWDGRFTHATTTASCAGASSPRPRLPRAKSSEFVALDHGLRRKLLARPEGKRQERMHPQSTDDWALRLHSCRALSSQPQDQLKTKMKKLKICPLTKQIPDYAGLTPFIGGQFWNASPLLNLFAA